MRNNSTIESLKAMRFSAMAAELERQMGDPSAYSQMGFEERLSLLVDAEWNCRQNNKLLRCIREARFATPGAVIEDVEYHEDRLRFSVLPPVRSLRKTTTSSLRVRPAVERPFLPVHWATLPVGD
jgi:hypothetical protein